MSKNKILLKGTPASAGVVKGRVKIILKPEDAKEMGKGEILVATETTPEYTAAILRASAIITDFGGVLSHPAIAAREMGIPGVVGTFKATKILKDGMEVVVDGTEGVVFQKSS